MTSHLRNHHYQLVKAAIEEKISDRFVKEFLTSVAAGSSLIYESSRRQVACLINTRINLDPLQFTRAQTTTHVHVYVQRTERQEDSTCDEE